LGIVVLNDKWGYIDQTGKIIVPIKYDAIHLFSEELAPANYGASKDELGYPLGGKFGYIDRTGKEVIAFIYDKAGSFGEGIAPVNIGATKGKYSMTGGKFGYIDKSGKEVIPFIYEQASRVSEGLAYVILNGKAGYIDKSGKQIIPFKYDRAGNFTEGLACVKLNGKYGYINPSDEVVIPFEYDEADNEFNNGLACVKKDGLYGFIDRTGKIVIPIKFESANSFRINIAGVKTGGKWGYVDTTGKIIIDAKYDYAGMFVNGKAKVKLNGEEFNITPNGKRYVDSKTVVSENIILNKTNTEPSVEIKTKTHSLYVYPGWANIFGNNLETKQYLTSNATGLKTSDLFSSAPNNWINNDATKEKFFGTIRLSFDDSETETTIAKEKKSFIEHCAYLSSLPVNKINYLEEDVILADARKGTLLFYYTDRTQNIGYILNCVIYSVSPTNSKYVSIYRSHMEGNTSPVLLEKDFSGWKDYFKKVLLSVKPITI